MMTLFASLTITLYLRIPDAVREAACRGNPESDAILNEILSTVTKFNETWHTTLEGAESGQAVLANSPANPARVLGGPQFEAGDEPVVGADYEFPQDCVMMHEQVTECLPSQICFFWCCNLKNFSKCLCNDHD